MPVAPLFTGVITSEFARDSGTIAKSVMAAAQRETGHGLSEALHQVDIGSGQIHLGIENRPPVARDAHVLRKNDTGVQFRKRLKTFRGEVEESQAPTRQANINTVKEVDAVLGRSPTCIGCHWGFKAFVTAIGGH